MIGILLIGVLLAVVIWQTVYARLWEKELSVAVAFKQPYVYAGEEAELTEVVENRKKMPVSPVEVGFQVKKGVQFREMENTSVSDYVYKRDIFSLLGNQRITRNIVMDCQKRGLYTIKDLSIGSFSILHKKKYRKQQSTEAQLYVYAKRTNVTAILQASENLLGEQESNRKYLEDPFVFSSIRGYTPQDPMKMINWKASAKTGEWMVNTYGSMKNERMMIYLDVEDRGIIKKEHLKEECISVAASLFQTLVKKGTEVGICVNLRDEEQGGVFYLKPARQRGQRMLLEQRLAKDWSDGELLDFEKVLECPFHDGIPVIISKNVSEQRVKQVEALIGSQARGIWVVPYEKGECPEIQSERFLVVKREVER